MIGIFGSPVKVINAKNSFSRSVPGTVTSNFLPFYPTAGEWGYLAAQKFTSHIHLPLIRGIRVRYKGKTIRSVRCFRKQILFKVGKSHPAMGKIFTNVYVKKTNKQRLTVWSYSLTLLRETVYNFRDQKYPNLYHGRGIRPNRMKLF